MSIKLKDTILDYIDKAYKDSSGNTISSTYLPLSGGTLTGFLKFNTSSTATYVQHKVNDVIKAELGYHPNYGVFIKNENSGKFLYVTDSGVAKFDGNTIIHSGNIGSQSVSYATSAGSATDQTARNAASAAQTTANGKWTYNADTIKAVKVNNAVYADSAGSTNKISVNSFASVFNKLYYTSKSVTMTTTNTNWYVKIMLSSYAQPNQLFVYCSYNNEIDRAIIDFSGMSSGYIFKNNCQNSGNIKGICFKSSYDSTEKKWIFWLKFDKILHTADLHYSPSSSATCTVYLSDQNNLFDISATTTDPGVSWITTGSDNDNIVIKNATLYGNLSGNATTATNVAWSGITGKPSTFTPSSHTHTKSQITDFPSSLPANGGNADTVDNKHASDFMACIEGSDFNPSDVIGNYVGMSTQTGITSSWTHVISLDWRSGGTTSISGGGNSSWETQLALPTQNRKGIYYRSFSSTAPYDWVRLIDSSNIGSQSVNYANSAGAVAWASVTGKPSTFTPSSHTHTKSQITDFPSSLPANGGNANYLNAVSPTSSGQKFWYYSGQPTIGSSSGNAYSGSSNDYSLYSFPTGYTATSTSTANIQNVRLFWSTAYWHDIYSSPNYRYLWHRWVMNGTANPWSRIVLENNGSESVTWNINISGSSGKATHADYLSTYTAPGTSSGGNVKCLQDAFSSIPKSVGTAVRLERGSHSMAFGWFLTGYGYSNAYGGWFISDYSTPTWVGVSNGTWTEAAFITTNNISSQSVNYASSAGSVAWGNVSGKPSTFTPSSHTHSDYMAKSDPIGSGTLRMDGSNSRGSFPAVKLHISGVNWSQMLMNGSGELEFRAGGSQDAAYVTTRMGACCCTTLYINGEQITFVT